MTDISRTEFIEGASNGQNAREVKEAKSVTKRDVTALLESFKPEAPQAESPAEKERKRRLKAWDSAVRSLAEVFDGLGATDGTAADAAASLRALTTVHKKGASAIAGISDGKLTGSPESKPARAPRKSAARTLSNEDAKAALERNEAAAEEEPSDAPVDEGVSDPREENGKSEAMAEEPRAEEGATPAPMQHRSGPPRSGPSSSTPERGDSDPNEGDGF